MVEECEAANGEELREVVQVAILTGMLLRVLQDRVFEMENAGDVQYHRVRDAIVGIMNIRARVLAPTPMDVGQVGGPVREGGEDSYDWVGEDEQSTFDVAAVVKGMSGVCLRCGGFGHFARECPMPERKGKGNGAKGGKGGVDFRFKGKGELVKEGWGWYGKSGFADNRLYQGEQEEKWW